MCVSAALTCLRRARGEGLGEGGAMRGGIRLEGKRGRAGEASGTWSRARPPQGWE